MSLPLFHLVRNQKIASFLILQFSLFYCTWKFTFLSDSFTDKQAKGEGQAYLHLTVTRNSMLTNQACWFTSLFPLDSFGKIHVLSVTSERHSVLRICTLRNMCWKRPEHSLPSAFPSMFQSVQNLLSGQKCRKNRCVIESKLLFFPEGCTKGGFIPFCSSSMQPAIVRPITAFWNISNADF